MKPKEKEPADVGVIVGRFQVDDLHEAHIDLIQTVVKTHPKVIIFLGLTPLKSTYRNPLDFEARKQMILEKFPNVNVLYINDMQSDNFWSKQLDSQIETLRGPNQSVVLYGGRDAFITHYTGKHECIEMEQTIYVSGKAKRKEISNVVKSSADFRKGVIWATSNQYINPKPTIDVCIIDEKNNILLGKKPFETKFRFVGGFVDLNETLEVAAKREAYEETNLEVEVIDYMGSFVVDDWRYRSEKANILTTFFLAKKIFGSVEPKDDIEMLEWFSLEEVSKKDLDDFLVVGHVQLMKKVLETIKEK